MLRTASSHRYQKSKGPKVKNAVQLVMLIVIVTWVSFQLKHSHRGKPAHVTGKVEGSQDLLSKTSIDPIKGAEKATLGRKGAVFELTVKEPTRQTVESLGAENQSGGTDLHKLVDGHSAEGDESSERVDIEEKIDERVADSDTVQMDTENTMLTQDGGDGDDEGEDDGEKNDAVTGEHDDLTEDFFNDDAENREEIENLLSEMADEQVQNDENIAIEMQSASSRNESDDAPLDFEGEGSLQDRKIVERQQFGTDDGEAVVRLKDNDDHLLLFLENRTSNATTETMKGNATGSSLIEVAESAHRNVINIEGTEVRNSINKTKLEAGQDDREGDLTKKVKDSSLRGFDGTFRLNAFDSSWTSPNVTSDFISLEQERQLEAETVSGSRVMQKGKKNQLNKTNKSLEERSHANGTLQEVAEHAVQSNRNQERTAVSKSSGTQYIAKLNIAPASNRNSVLSVSITSAETHERSGQSKPSEGKENGHLELFKVEEHAGATFQQDAVL